MKNLENKLTIEDKWTYLSSLFERDGVLVGETELTISINGIYSIPEEWLRLEASGAVDAWFYGAKVSDLNFTEGKTNPREMTEAEKKELEAKKNTKNDKKKVELTQAELDKIEKERLQKEEKEKKMLEEWNELDEQTKFYRKKENPTEECWISFPNGKNALTIMKNADKLLDLEEEVNTDHGMLLEFFKVPPHDEDPKKRPKPKNLPPEEIKPIHTVAWLDLSELQVPGCRETTLRASLMLKETYEKKLEIEEIYKKFKTDNGDEERIAELEEELQNLTDYVLQKQTYIYLTISLSIPINPKVPENAFPKLMELIKKPEKPFKRITAEQICNDFRNQLKIAISAIAKQYGEFMGEAKNNLIKRDKTNVLSNDRKQERDSNITKFIYNFNQSGKADLLNEKLKKFIVRIVREKYQKKTNVMGVFKNEKDQFYSSLFAYLTDEVKVAMDELVYINRQDLHDDVITSYEQSRKEVLNYASRTIKEDEEQRLYRLGKEYDIRHQLEKSLFYCKARLTLNKSKESWKEYTILTKKMGRIIDTEDSIINIIHLDSEDINFKILYAAIKWIKGRPNDAINFLQVIIEEEMKGIKNSNSSINAFLALLYKEAYIQTKDKMKDLYYKKHWESAIRLKLKESGNTQFSVGKSKFKLTLETSKSKAESLKISDEKKEEISNTIYHKLCEFFNEYYMSEITEKILQIQIFSNPNNKSSIVFKLEWAFILLYKKQYDNAIEVTNEIISVEKNNYSAWLIRGNCYYFKKDLYNSEESYIKAIRYKPENVKFDTKMLYRLGMTYISRTTWIDAKTVFLKILKEEPGYSFAWENLGLSLMRLGEYEAAEEALNEANLLDIDNMTIWGYLCIFCILNNRKFQALECLNELTKMQFQDTTLLEEIADRFLKLGEFNLAAEIYNRIIFLLPNNLKIYFKLAGVYSQIESKKNEAVELLKNRLRNTDDESDKKKIIKFLDYLNKEIGLSDKKDTNLYQTYEEEDDLEMGNDSLVEYI